MRERGTAGGKQVRHLQALQVWAHDAAIGGRGHDGAARRVSVWGHTALAKD